MLLVRRIGLAVLAVAAIAVFLLMAPGVSSDTLSGSFDIAIDIAEDTYSANATRTESAPQQQVVNGWYANDLLNIIARENSLIAAHSTGDRTAALLAIGVLAIALWGATSVPALRSDTAETLTEATPLPPIPEPSRADEADEG